MKTIDWYFDFISPFAYLQSESMGSFDGLAQVHYKPVLFAGFLNHWGHRGPAEIPKKTDVHLSTRDLAGPPSWDSLNLSSEPSI